MEEKPQDIVLIDISTTDLTMEQVMARMESYRQNGTYQGYEIFLDGKLRAIVARPKK